MTLDVLAVVLMLFLLVTAWGVLRLRDLFSAAMLLGMFSLVSAALFTIFDAVDVAFTEASVGAGISTILMLATLGLTTERETSCPAWRPVPLLAVLVTGGLLIYGTLDMPSFGDPQSPVHTYLGARYLEEEPKEIGVPNVVTAVLASYRGYDTLGEATVVFAAAIGVLLLLSDRREERDRSSARALKDHLARDDARHAPAMKNRILRVSARPMIPSILLFGLYVQFHGDYGPGGGFQAGVIMAAGVVLFALVFGLERTRRTFSANLLEAMIALGVLLYGSVGVWSMLAGGNFLDYDVLLHDPKHGQHLGIVLVELGVGITVTAVMIALFLLFAARGLDDAKGDLHLENGAS
ncbi:MAG: DUF4040 domain-containing protein [Acidobacteriota bacterium]